MRVVTDSTPVDQPKDPDACNLFALYRLFNPPEQVEELRARYLAPGLKYVTVKKQLAEDIWNFFEPHREKRAKLMEHPDTIRDILNMGARKGPGQGHGNPGSGPRPGGVEILKQLADSLSLTFDRFPVP